VPGLQLYEFVGGGVESVTPSAHLEWAARLVRPKRAFTRRMLMLRPLSLRHPCVYRTGLWVAALLTVGCSEPELEFGEQGFLIVGAVRRSGIPQPGIVVRIYGFIGPCRMPEGLAPPVITGPDGMYRYQDRSPFSPGTEFCGLARAFFDNGGTPDSLTVSGFVIKVAALAPNKTPLDSTVVDFELPVP
jgi:hypothetical protein